MRVYATSADLTDYAGPEVVDADSPDCWPARPNWSTPYSSPLSTAPDRTGTSSTSRCARRYATCAVVQWWAETGDPAAASQYTETQIGTLRLKRSDTHSAPEIAPATMRILGTAGLLAHAPLAPDVIRTGWTIQLLQTAQPRSEQERLDDETDASE